jgi:hypothetical protein
MHVSDSASGTVEGGSVKEIIFFLLRHSFLRPLALMNMNERLSVMMYRGSNKMHGEHSNLSFHVLALSLGHQ